MKNSVNTVCRYTQAMIFFHCIAISIAYIFFENKEVRNLHQCTFSNFLQALESFLLRCPRDISPYCDDILILTMEYLSYDPNFTDNMEEDTDAEGDDEEEDEYVAQTFKMYY